ncbi:MAG TPA: hypothetical protein VFJ51_14165 [Nitrososphaeraceae archaeon]|nr:hypothetical protein [Nitrososphaeraceae archaeon]
MSSNESSPTSYECGMTFGSFGGMRNHTTMIEHLQKGDIHLKEKE